MIELRRACFMKKTLVRTVTLIPGLPVFLLCLHIFVGKSAAEEMDLPDFEIQGRGATLLFSGPGAKKSVALTFDDGPRANQTPLLLDILGEKRVAATFFLLGANVEANPAIVRRIVEEGHEVGNHTYNHKNLKQLKPSGVSSEIKKTQEVIFEAAGVRPRLFRPPFGATDLTTMATLANVGLTAIYWSLDTKDWKGASPEAIRSRVLEGLTNGSIILFHDHGAHTLEVLPDLIDTIRGKGYSLETVSSLFNLGQSPEAPLVAKSIEETSPETTSPDSEAIFASVQIPTPRPVVSHVPATGISAHVPSVVVAFPQRTQLPMPGDFPTPLPTLPLLEAPVLLASGNTEGPLVQPSTPTATSTPTETIPPTSTPPPPPSPTWTPLPAPPIPTATETPPPATPTTTPIPPTETLTPEVPTKTPTAVKPSPTSTATSTASMPPVPTRTPTRTATRTSTRTPTPTRTPSPASISLKRFPVWKRANQIRRLVPVREFSVRIDVEPDLESPDSGYNSNGQSPPAASGPLGYRDGSGNWIVPSPDEFVPR